MDHWFWILVGFAAALIAVGLICLAVFAFFNWQRRAVEAATRRRRALADRYNG